MKRIVVVAALGFFLFGPVRALADDQLDPGYEVDSRPANLAPADAYFGRFRMSILGIKNAISDVARRIDGAAPEELPALFHKLMLVEDAFIDLKQRYPLESWLPRMSLSLAQAYEKFPFDAAQSRAQHTFDWLIADYPDSDEAVYALDLREPRLRVQAANAIPIEPELPSYAVPGSDVRH